jgi:hypothetical protein
MNTWTSDNLHWTSTGALDNTYAWSMPFVYEAEEPPYHTIPDLVKLLKLMFLGSGMRSGGRRDFEVVHHTSQSISLLCCNFGCDLRTNQHTNYPKGLERARELIMLITTHLILNLIPSEQARTRCC